MALGWLWWRAWARLVARGRCGTWRHPTAMRGTWRHLPWFCVAGLALMALGWLWWRTWARLVAGDAAALCVAGVALGDIHLRFNVGGVALGDIYLVFAWQAWHLWHWAGSGGALGRAWSPVTPRYFAWQAWHLATSTFVSRARRGAWRHLPWFCVAGVALMALGWLWWLWWLAPLCHTPPFTHHL